MVALFSSLVARCSAQPPDYNAFKAITVYPLGPRDGFVLSVEINVTNSSGGNWLADDTYGEYREDA